MVPLMPRLYTRPLERPNQRNCRQWWKYACTCIIFCVKASKPKELWCFSDYALYLLRERADYTVLLRALVVSTARLVVFNSVSPPSILPRFPVLAALRIILWLCISRRILCIHPNVFLSRTCVCEYLVTLKVCKSICRSMTL